MKSSKKQSMTKVSTLDAGVAELAKQLRDAGINPSEAVHKELRKAAKSPKKTAREITANFFTPQGGLNDPVCDTPRMRGKKG